jgi:hypothetical protein
MGTIEGVKTMNIEHGKCVGYQVRDWRGLVRATLETEQDACKAARSMSRGGGSYPASVCRVETIIELTRYFGGEEKPLF